MHDVRLDHGARRGVLQVRQLRHDERLWLIIRAVGDTVDRANRSCGNVECGNVEIRSRVPHSSSRGGMARLPGAPKPEAKAGPNAAQ